MADHHGTETLIMTDHAAQSACIAGERLARGDDELAWRALCLGRENAMRMMPEMFLLVALMAALLGFSTTNPGLARAGQGIFFASIIFVLVSMMMENWKVEGPDHGTLA